VRSVGKYSVSSQVHSPCIKVPRDVQSKGEQEHEKQLEKAIAESKEEQIQQDKEAALKLVSEEIQEVIRQDVDGPLPSNPTSPKDELGVEMKNEQPQQGEKRDLPRAQEVQGQKKILLFSSSSPKSSPRGSPAGKSAVSLQTIENTKIHLAASGNSVTSYGYVVAVLKPNAANGPHTIVVVSEDHSVTAHLKVWQKGPQALPAIGARISFTGRVRKVDFRPKPEDLEHGTAFYHPNYYNNNPHEISVTSWKIDAVGDGTAPVVTIESCQRLPPSSIVTLQVYLKGFVLSDSNDVSSEVSFTDQCVIVDEGAGRLQGVVWVPYDFDASSIPPGTLVTIKNVIRRGHYGELVRVPFALSKTSQLEFYEPPPQLDDASDVPPPLEDEHGNLYAEDGEPATKKRSIAGGN
jgi:hypothetical protein